MTPLIALVLAQSFFTWSDKDGTEHFTDDKSKVPKGAKFKTTTGADINSEEAAPKPPPVQTQLSEKLQAPTATRDDRALENQWRSAFRTAAARISELEREIEVLHKHVEEVNGLPVTGTLNCRYAYRSHSPGYPISYCWPTVDANQQREKLATLRAHLVTAKADLDELYRRAAFDAVPLEWRH